MAATECGFGHIYDSDIYPVCPYCNGSQPVIHFGQTPVGESGRTMGPAGAGYPPVRESGRTQPLDGGWGPSPTERAGWGPRPAETTGGGVPVTEGGKTVGPRPSGESRAVTDDSVTRPPRGYDPPKERRVVEDQKTEGELKRKLGIDPAVGWLVCIRGAEKGKDYRLLGRINTIGSAERMDVCIKGDKTISKVNHARIGYGEKTNRFTLIPADGSNVIYLNGEEVYSPAALSPYDVIEFGETALVFIPLCSDRFTWEKGVMESEAGV